MKILVACEFSGIVRDAFLARGHDVLSCDLLPSEKPGPHYQGDVQDILLQEWDMLIAFPPCTYLCAVGAAWWYRQPWRLEAQKEALQFVQFLMDAPIPKIALENPVGVISTYVRKPDQIIQPYYFGHEESKKTCLWLKNLPPLMSTLIYTNPREFVNHAPKNGIERQKIRSRTFIGIAQAMANQWG